MSKIHLLSALTIDQIAAGEVIENPASVVKELIENAIDAGSRQVKIEIMGGGFQLIKISDEGSGMSPDDAILCFERHATSKISSAEDLFELQTMGFRGEALASIAAISKLQLITALEDAGGTSVEVEGGKILHVGRAARSRGTTMEVRSLFYNVPARKKFQKSPAASSAEITKVVTQLALAHPEVGFDLFQQNRAVFSLLPAGQEDFLTLLKRRATELLGADFAPSCREFTVKEQACEGGGLLADPLYARPNRSGQYLFVNRRPVHCLPIAFAIRDAYGTRLNTGQHPAYVLHLHIPPQQIDVNVHPQKKEIRLREESLLKYALHSAINAALSLDLCSVPIASSYEPSSFFSRPAHFSSSEAFIFQEQADAPSASELPFHQPLQLIGSYGRYAILSAESMPAQLVGQHVLSGVVWIDLPAAVARVHFDALIEQAESTPLSQGLLLPLSFSFSQAESELLKTHLEQIQKLGLQIRAVAQNGFIVEGIPLFIGEGEVQELLIELIGELQGLREKSREETVLRSLAAVISREARFRRRFYSSEETLAIVQQLISASDPLHCPRGKKTLFHIKEEEIERYFTAKSK